MMDTDLFKLWLQAEFLSKDEVRDLITELQTARDEAASEEEVSEEEAAQKAAEDMREAVVPVREAYDELSVLIGELDECKMNELAEGFAQVSAKAAELHKNIEKLEESAE